MNAALDVACHLNVLAPDTSPEHLPAALAAVAAAGYRRIVLPPLDPDAIDAAALRAMVEDSGLSPITMCGQSPDADVSSADPDVRAAGVAALLRVLDLTVALGSDQLNGVSYGVFGHPAAPTSREAFERSAAEVGRVADEAHSRGVMMTFEVLNRYETSLVNTAARAMEYVAASGSDSLRIHLDTFHMAIEEADMAAAIRTALPKLGYLELGQSGRGSLATGVVDIPSIVRGALSDGYTGRFGLEAFTRPVLPDAVGDMLAIWRTTYADGAQIAEEAMHIIQNGTP
jgi:D-psicose/D-tagatose/L-ribulose 3-epimerase